MRIAANRLTPHELITGVREVFVRELASYFDSNIAYVYTIAFTLLANSQFMNDFFLAGTVEMAPFFHRLPFLLVFFVPAVTMRLWAEEKKTRTIELLLTLPIFPVQAVLGKYVAALGLFLAFLVHSLVFLLNCSQSIVAITFSSTAIGVGKALTSTVVRDG